MLTLVLGLQLCLSEHSLTPIFLHTPKEPTLFFSVLLKNSSQPIKTQAKCLARSSSIARGVTIVVVK